jgi:hypothetical protein
MKLLDEVDRHWVSGQRSAARGQKGTQKVAGTGRLYNIGDICSLPAACG